MPPVESAGAGCDVVRLAAVVPLSGSLGLCGPSALACARLGVDEVNLRGGILGREVEIVVVDGGRRPGEVADEVAAGVEHGRVEAVVGMHTSDVRVAVSRRLGGTVPYVYTPPYEGGERTPGVILIGETPDQQLQPVIERLVSTRHAQRWFLVGNDYVWPRRTHASAASFLKRCGGQVVGERFVPMGSTNFGELVETIVRSRSQAVLLSLVGADQIAFHRQIAQHPGASGLVRLSTSLEENVLLGMGGDDSGDVYAAMGYFASLATDASLSFLGRYVAAYGDEAPPLSAHGQSAYEGVLALEAMAAQARSLRVRDLVRAGQGATFTGARGARTVSGNHVPQPVYLARAEGLDLPVVSTVRQAAGHI